MSTPPPERTANSSESPAVPPPTDGAVPTLAPGDGGTLPQSGPSPAALAGGPAIQVPGYVIQRELGRGGMGVVYLARNVLMNRPEVLKVVNKALLDRPGVKERFLREIRAAAKLGHENVVKAYTALQVGDLLVFAMEYVEGQDLAQIVKRQGPLPVAHACHYASQAAMGLQHAHEQGMVHRDIKPHNLILSRRGKRHVVKVLDFGLAKAAREGETATDLTGDGVMLGTPAYMAPEQGQDAARADIRADVYSLGCTLYFLLTGTPPFTGQSLYAILYAHMSTAATPLSQLRTETPAGLEAVVARMMAKDPARRYQKPVEAAKALAPFVKAAPAPAGSPPPARPPSAPSIFDRPTHVDPDPKPAATAARAEARKAGGPSPAVRPARNKGDTTAVAPVRKGSTARARPRAKWGVGKWLMVAASIGVALLLAAGEVWLWNGDPFRAKTWPGVPGTERPPAKPATPDKGSDKPSGRPATPDKKGQQLPSAKPSPASSRPTETEAVAAIEAIKGTVHRDEDGQVDNVDLSNCGATDSDLSYVRAFPRLKKLGLIGGAITDAGLAYLAETPTLEELSIEQDKVTGNGIQVLGKLPRLSWLDLAFDGEGSFPTPDFQVIGTCKALDVLNINFTKLPAGSLRFLGKLPRLRWLDLAYAGVTDEFLDDIAACKSIENLDLQGAAITGVGLKKLGQLPRLSKLSLARVQTLADDDLKSLRDCSQLRDVMIEDAKFTAQGVINLMEVRSLQIIRVGDDLLTGMVKEVFKKDRPDVAFNPPD